MSNPWTACFLFCCFAHLTILATEDDLPAGTLLWDFEADGNVMATPVLDHDRVYFGSAADSATETASSLYCVDRNTGEEVWSTTFPNWMLGAPVITASRLLVGCDNTKLYCLDKATGEELWHFDTSGRIDSTPAVDTQGNCYFGSRDRFFYALDPSGTERWKVFLTGGVASSPIIDEANGVVYVADLANTMYAYTLSGTELWSYKPRLGNIDGLRLRIYSSPALDRNGLLYVGSGDHHLYAVNTKTGNLFWREDTGGIVDASPVISGAGHLYVANREGILFSYDIGLTTVVRERWRSSEIGQVFYGSPSIDAANNVYICGAPPLENPEDPPQSLLSYVHGDTKEVLWTANIPGYTDGTPALDEQGDIYIGSAANKLYKIRGAGLPPVDAAWPTFHGGPSGHGRYEETFTEWLGTYSITPDSPDEDIDSDEDGFSDFEEFIAGTEPNNIASHPHSGFFQPKLQPDSGNALPAIRFEHPKGIRAPFSLKYSADLRSWSNVFPDPTTWSFIEDINRWEVTIPLPMATEEDRLFRIEWER